MSLSLPDGALPIAALCRHLRYPTFVRTKVLLRVRAGGRCGRARELDVWKRTQPLSILTWRRAGGSAGDRCSCVLAAVSKSTPAASASALACSTGNVGNSFGHIFASSFLPKASCVAHETKGGGIARSFSTHKRRHPHFKGSPSFQQRIKSLLNVSLGGSSWRIIDATVVS